ncbi:unnamed protein product [Parajaminaea phylloscopi]
MSRSAVRDTPAKGVGASVSESRATKKAQEEKYYNDTALAEKFQTHLGSGVGRLGALGRQALRVWEQQLTIDGEWIDAWPHGPRAAESLKKFQTTVGDSKPNTLSSWYHRWPLGITSAAYGTLEDVRYITWESEIVSGSTLPSSALQRFPYTRDNMHDPLKAEQPSHSTSRPSMQRPTGDNDWVFDDRHDPGAEIPRDPLERASGGIFAACFLAVAYHHTLLWAHGWNETKLTPSQPVAEQWPAVLEKVYENCFLLRRLRSGYFGLRARDGTATAKAYHCVCVDAAVTELIKFVWRHAYGGKTHLQDKNVQAAWSSLHQKAFEDHQFIMSAWASLRRFANDHLEAHAQQVEAASTLHADDAAVEEPVVFDATYDDVDLADAPAGFAQGGSSEAQVEAHHHSTSLFTVLPAVDDDGDSHMDSASDADSADSVADAAAGAQGGSHDPAILSTESSYDHGPEAVADVMTPFAPLQHAQPDGRDGTMTKTIELLGDIKPALDPNALSTALIAEFVPNSTAEDDGEDGESGETEAADDPAAAAVTRVVERQGWTSPWHGLSVPELQRRLCFWTTFAQTYAAAEPLTHAQMEEAVTAVVSRIAPLVDEWTLENFLRLRPHRHLYRCRGGKSATEVNVEESRFALTAAQLESALWLLHKLMASEYEGADEGALLGDSMGVGKTYQAIVFALLVHKLGLCGGRPTMVMASKKLLDQWLAAFFSIADTAPSSYHGNGSPTAGTEWGKGIRAIALYAGHSAEELPPEAGSESIVLVPPTTCHATMGQAGGSLLGRKWGLVVADEAHLLHAAKSKEMDKGFQRPFFAKANIRFRLLLSGTPMSNIMTRQYTLLRIAGSCHIPRDQHFPAPKSRWLKVAGLAKDMAKVMDQGKDPTAELAAAQFDLAQACAVSGTGRTEKIRTQVKRVGNCLEAMMQVAAGYWEAEEAFGKAMLPYFNPILNHTTPSPRPHSLPILLRRFLPAQMPFVARGFTIRAEGTKEFRAVHANALGAIRAKAGIKGDDIVLNATNGLWESAQRIAAAQPALLSDPGAFQATQMYREALEGREEKYGPLSKDIEDMEAKLLAAGLPTRHIPTRPESGDNWERVRTHLDDYGKLFQWRQERSRFDLATFCERLDLGTRSKRQALLEQLETPLASMLVPLVSNILRADQGLPSTIPALTNILPKARQPGQPAMKILIFCLNHVTVAWVGHVLRAYGMRSAHLVNTSATSQADLIRKWETSADLHILFVTTAQTTGLELQMASALIFWDTPTMDSMSRQAVGRVVRPGQCRDPVIYVLEAEGTYNDTAASYARSRAAVAACIDGPTQTKRFNCNKALTARTLEIIRDLASEEAISVFDLRKLQQSYCARRFAAIVRERGEKAEQARRTRLQVKEKRVEGLAKQRSQQEAAVTRAEQALPKTRADCVRRLAAVRNEAATGRWAASTVRRKEREVAQREEVAQKACDSARSALRGIIAALTAAEKDLQEEKEDQAELLRDPFTPVVAPVRAEWRDWI